MATEPSGGSHHPAGPEQAAAEIAALDFSAVTPEEFARTVKGLSGRQLAELATGELRTRVLREVFGRMEQQFRPDRAGALHAVIRWRVTGESEAVYDTVIADGSCTVREGPGDAEPRTTLTMGDVEFLRLVSGNAGPVALFISRRLKVAGDVGLAARLAGLFDIPKAG